MTISMRPGGSTTVCRPTSGTSIVAPKPVQTPVEGDERED